MPPSGLQERNMQVITFFLIVFLNTQQFLIDVGELCASRVWVDVVIYMLSAMGLNFSGAESAYPEIAVSGKWLMVSIWNDCLINCEVEAVKWYS